MGSLNRKLALGILAVMTVSAPLAFGAGDRIVQVALAALLAAGMLCVPPEFPVLGNRGKWLAAGFVALLLVKEFGPAFVFEKTDWRSLLTENFGIAFPWTHNPEPARALDGLLSLAIGALWFCWVRTLTQDRGERLAVAWIVFGSAVVLAVVCFTMPGQGSGSIYGVRPTPSWSGFGPFPNRNHTACFLAMGVVAGCACSVQAVRRKQGTLLILALAGIATAFVALLESRSRGGLIACVAGLTIFAALAFTQSKSRQTVSIVVASALVTASLFLAFGAKIWSRFGSGSESDIPTNLRWGVWRDSLSMWQDAPVFGHGVGSFAQLFPMYQTLDLVNQLVLHPESSWMKWLVELGLLTLLAAIVAGAFFLFRHLRDAMQGTRGFVLRAGGLAAFAVLMIHSIYDVPAHRWATAGLGLAALAMACPVRTREGQAPGSRLWALGPVCVVAFWLLPIWGTFPAWSPERLTRIMARQEAAPEQVRFTDLEKLATYFPLHPELRQALGMRLVRMRPSEAFRHFRLVDRLRPGSWTLPAMQAFATRAVSPGMTLHYWTLAIERAGHRRSEVFGMANRYTIELPTAASFWARYAATHPELLLMYAAAQPDAQAPLYFQQWWESRALGGSVTDEEADLFYRLLPRWGNVTQLRSFIETYPGREQRDFKAWSAILHASGDDAAAWQLLARNLPEPGYPEQQLSTRIELLESGWMKDPRSVVIAQALASAWHRRGDITRSRKVIFSVAAQENAPSWFLRKAAYLHATDGALRQAVAMLLREK